MRVRVDDPTLLGDLARTLRERIDAVVERQGDDLRVSLLGSIRQEHLQRELEQRLRPWRLRHPNVKVEVDPHG